MTTPLSLRDDRKARGFTLAQEASRLGIPVCELQDRENPDPKRLVLPDEARTRARKRAKKKVALKAKITNTKKRIAFLVGRLPQLEAEYNSLTQLFST